MSDGIVKYKTAFSQPLLFEGVEFKTETNAITPTDIDAVLEFRDRLIVFIEVKTYKMDIPRGQRVAFERICRSSSSTDRTSVGLLCWHSVKKPSPIYLRDLYVGRAYTNIGGKWRWAESKNQKMLIDSLNNLLDLTGIEDVKRCVSPEPSISNCPF